MSEFDLTAGDGAPAADPAPAPAAADPTDDAKAAAHDRYVEYRGEKVEIPENYWDKDGKTVNIAALLKSNGDLRTRLNQVPKPPETYDLGAGLPEDLKGAVDLSADNPAVADGVAILKKHGLSQAAAADLAGWLARRDAGVNQALDKAEAEATAQALAETETLLGGKDSLNSVKAWAKEALKGQPFSTTPAGWAALNDLRLASGSASVPGGRGADIAAEPALSAESLKQMQADPRYWKTQDPDYIAKVKEGYRRLYGE